MPVTYLVSGIRRGKVILVELASCQFLASPSPETSPSFPTPDSQLATPDSRLPVPFPK
ncbi:MAG: hypothetical protein F6K65_19185 [Moorea sp. SIO3C2]|nr:hypothetical protein [Moorena sp. SIO3C2]